MDSKPFGIPDGYSYTATAGWFFAGAFVTSIFSGSLAMLTNKAELFEVLLVSMIVPSFTWVVQMTASSIGMPSIRRKVYWGDLGRVCLLGSFALLPAAFTNFWVTEPPFGHLVLSVVNVLVSVEIMARDLFRRSARHGIAIGWPISWCLTITLNMYLFLLASSKWWPIPDR